MGCNGPFRHVGLGRRNGANYTPVSFGFKGSELGSKLGPVASNGENIASIKESLGMRPRILGPCGRQRNP